MFITIINLLTLSQTIPFYSVDFFKWLSTQQTTRAAGYIVWQKAILKSPPCVSISNAFIMHSTPKESIHFVFRWALYSKYKLGTTHDRVYRSAPWNSTPNGKQILEKWFQNSEEKWHALPQPLRQKSMGKRDFWEHSYMTCRKTFWDNETTCKKTGLVW